MIKIPLSSTPNQSFSARLDNSLYDFTIRTVNDTACIDVLRDNEPIITAMRLTPGTPVLPYKYQQTGNFMFTTLNDELPDYTKFGVSQNLFYLTIAELEALGATA